MASAAVAPFEIEGAVAPRNRVDELVFARWKALHITPARLCSDSVFLRRAWLDLTGTLPEARQAAEFLNSRDPAKRAVLVDQLLEREEFADYRAMQWSDLLRIKAEFPINLWPNAAQAYYHWTRAALRQNQPYDRFVSALLTSSGSNFRDPAVNFYRALEKRDPEGIAQAVALTFMGVRADKWPAAPLKQMSAFFSQLQYKHTGEWKEEIVFFDPDKAALKALAFPDGSKARLRPRQDPREVFAAWLTGPRNPWFARNIVNRTWFWLLGRGIVHEPDDMRPDNPPENPELLAWLERELVSAHYDLRHIYRLILNSSTYQLSPVPQSEPARAAEHFAVYPLRRLDAEVLIDALCQITGTGETYTSAIPEPYTYMPDFQRAVSLPDGSISSPFLELFGRPARDTGLAVERTNRITAAQRLHLLNSTHVRQKVQGPRITAMLRNQKDAVGLVYLTVLSRYPTPEERKIAVGNADLVWALVNGAEFLYRH